MAIPFTTGLDCLFHERKLRRNEQSKKLLHFPECEVLPGAQKLLRDLDKARNTSGTKIQITLASSSEKYQYDLKATNSENKEFLDLIPEEYRVLGDDPRVQHGRGKVAPDIYLLALHTNDHLEAAGWNFSYCPGRMLSLRGQCAWYRGWKASGHEGLTGSSSWTVCSVGRTGVGCIGWPVRAD